VGAVHASALVVVLIGLLLPAAGPAGLLRSPGASDFEAGRELYAAGDYDGALQKFEAARALAPDEARLSLAVGATLFQLGRMEEAEREFQRARGQAKDRELEAESLYDAGTTRLVAGDAAGAVDLLRESLRRDPDRADALHNLELAQRRLEEASEPESQPQQQGDEGESSPEPQEGSGQQDQPQQSEDQEQPSESAQDEPAPQRDQRASAGDDQQPQAEQPPEAPADSSEAQVGEDQKEPSSPSAEEPESAKDGEEGLTREQALRLLRALDRDEEELKRAVQKRLQGPRPKSGKRW
jgi:Ca-activated chloride channel family protein